MKRPRIPDKTAAARKDRRKIFYALYIGSIFFLLVLSLTLSALDLAGVIDLHSPPYYQIDLTLTALFWIEYLARLVLVKDKGEYFKENIIELISILPFSKEFGYLHLIRFLRFVRVGKLLHFHRNRREKSLLCALRRTRRELAFVMNTRGFIYALYFSVLLMLTLIYAVEKVEGIRYADALAEILAACFTAAILTAPPSIFGQITAGIFMSIITSLVVWFILAAAAYFHRRSRISRSVKHTFLSQ